MNKSTDYSELKNNNNAERMTPAQLCSIMQGPKKEITFYNYSTVYTVQSYNFFYILVKFTGFLYK